MKQVTTKLTDEQIAEIEKSGTTVYKFLQIAVNEKLENDKKEKGNDDTTNILLEVIKSVNLRLEEIQKELTTNNVIAKDKLQLIAEIIQEKNQ